MFIELDEEDPENQHLLDDDNMYREHSFEKVSTVAQDMHEEDGKFGEEMVHQLIETIEFVLGSISNTASYLRLWALSLAHGQLASVDSPDQVFLALLMGGSLRQPSNVLFGGAGIIIGYAFLAVATVGILLMMDALECFLHALRLHW